MKKKSLFVTILATIMICFSAFIFVGCDKKVNIKTESVQFYVTENGTKTIATEVTLIVNQVKQFEIGYLPGDAQNAEFEVFVSDTRIATCVPTENPLIYDVIASEEVVADNNQTTICVRVTGDRKVQGECIINLIPAPINLDAPSSVTYNENTHTIEWATVYGEGFDGYVLNINGEDKPKTSANTYVLEPTDYNKNLTVKVKTKGVVKEVDSREYSPSLTFMALGAPTNLQHKDCVISWNRIPGAVSYKINVNGQVIDISGSSEDIVRYVGTFADVGSYSVSVQAIGNITNNMYSSDFSSEINFVRLPAPTDFKFSNGELLSWKTVNNASSYKILTNDNVNTVQTLSPLTTLKKIDTSKLPEGNINFKICAIGNGTSALTSPYAEQNTIKLNAPTNLRVENGIIVWDEVANAQSYLLSLGNITVQLSDSSITEYALTGMNGDLFPAGEYKITVKSVGDGVATINSSNSSNELQTEKLTTPTIKIENQQVSWAIENTLGGLVYTGTNPTYTLKIEKLRKVTQGSVVTTVVDEEKEIETTNNTFTLDNTYQASLYNFSVMVNCDDKLNSNFSLKTQGEKQATPTNLRIQNGLITWDGASTKCTYILSVDSTDEINVGFFKHYDLGGYAEGEHDVRVKAVCNVNYSFDSDFTSQAIAAYKLRTPELTLLDGNVQKDIPTYATSVKYYVNGILKNDTSINDGLEGEMISYQSFAIGDSSLYINSDISNELNVRRLPQVKNLKVENNKIVWDGISGFGDFTYEFVYKLIPLVVENGVNEINYTTRITQTEYSMLGQIAGKYNVTIQCIGSNGNAGEENLLKTSVVTPNINVIVLGTTSLSATEVNFDINNLGSLPWSSVNDLPGMLKWDSVEYASRYQIDVENTGLTFVTKKYVNKVNEQSVFYDLDVAPDQYNLSITAIGPENSNYIMQDATKYYIVSGATVKSENTFTKAIAPTSINIANDVLSWNSDYNNSSLPTVGFMTVIEGVPYANTGNPTAKNISFLDYIRNIPSNRLCKGTVYALPLNGVEFPVVGVLTNNMLLSAPSEEFQFTKISAPQNVTVRNSDIYWEYSGLGTGYTLEYTNGKTDSEVVIYKTIQINDLVTNTYHFDALGLLNDESIRDTNGNPINEYFIRVRVDSNEDNDLITSEYSNTFKTTILIPQSMEIRDGVLAWGQVDGTINYKLSVKINGGEPIVIYTNETARTFYSNRGEIEKQDSRYVDGNYEFTLELIGNESSYISSLSSVSLNATKLSAPTNLKVVNGAVVYDNVENANSFIINLSSYNNAPLSVDLKKATSTELDFVDETNNSLLVQPISYDVKVSAEGSRITNTVGLPNYLNSDYSDSINIRKLDNSASIPSVSMGEVIWGYTTDGTGYLLKVNENVEDLKLNRRTALDNYLSGELSVKIKVKGNSNNLVNSYYTNSISVYKQAQVTNVRIENGILVWDKVNDLENSNIKLFIKKHDATEYYAFDNLTLTQEELQNGVLVTTEINSLEMSTANLGGYIIEPNVEYDIFMQNIGDSESKINSLESNLKEGIKKLSAPTNLNTATSENEHDGVFTFDKVYIDQNLYTGSYDIYVQQMDVNGNSVGKYKIMTTTENELIIGERIDITTSSGTTSIEIKSGTLIFTTKTIGDNDLLLNSEVSEELRVLKPSDVRNIKATKVSTTDGVSVYTGEVTWTAPSNLPNAYYRVAYHKLQAGEEWNIAPDGQVTRVNVYTYQEVQQQIAELQESGGNQTEIELLKNYYTSSYTNSVNSFFVSEAGTYVVYVFAYVSGMFTLESDCPDEPVVFNFDIFEGKGTLESPYLIDSTAKFNFISNNRFAHYKLTKDLDFSTSTFTQLSSSEKPFMGSVDGNNYVLSNITLSSISQTYMGIIPYLGSTGEVKNLKVTNISIFGGQFVGGIVGYNNSGTVTHCEVSGIINPTYDIKDKKLYAGGIVGYNYNGNITLCVNSANVNPKNSLHEVYAGGITAFSDGGIISKCGNIGTVGRFKLAEGEELLINTSVICANSAGGIVGISNHATIEQCYNGGLVSAKTNKSVSFITDGFVGGLVGKTTTDSKITNCYTTETSIVCGVVDSASDVSIYIGGLVGNNSGIIKYCYTLSQVRFAGELTSYIGGLVVGYNNYIVDEVYVYVVNPTGPNIHTTELLINVKGSAVSEDMQVCVRCNSIETMKSQLVDAFITNASVYPEDLQENGSNIWINVGDYIRLAWIGTWDSSWLTHL